MKVLMVLPLFALLHSAAAGAEAVSFGQQIVPILKRNCVACHVSGQEQGGLALVPKAAYGSLVNVASKESVLARVKPGAPAESYFLRKVEGSHLAAGGTGVQMPMGGTPLSKEERALIQQWIEEGALQN